MPATIDPVWSGEYFPSGSNQVWRLFIMASNMRAVSVGGHTCRIQPSAIPAVMSSTKTFS
jgi:hypothetical protein